MTAKTNCRARRMASARLANGEENKGAILSVDEHLAQVREEATEAWTSGAVGGPKISQGGAFRVSAKVCKFKSAVPLRLSQTSARPLRRTVTMRSPSSLR